MRDTTFQNLQRIGLVIAGGSLVTAMLAAVVGLVALTVQLVRGTL